MLKNCMYKVSIIVPVYNVSSYIERCIKSIMSQTYSELECIIVNDATPDDSIEKCEKMISQYDGPIIFKILHHDMNRGLSASRNTGTKIANGDYIFYLDSDDEITKNCITTLVEVAQENNGIEIVQGYTSSAPFRDYYQPSYLDNVNIVKDNGWVRKNFYTINKKLPVNAWNKLIKKDFLEEKQLYFKEGLIHEDELWMFFVVKYLHYYGVVHDVTYIHYSEVEGSIMSADCKSRGAYHWSVILNEVIHNIDAPYYKEQFLVYLRKFVYYYGLRGKIPYSLLLDEYRNVAKNNHQYIIYYLLFVLEINNTSLFFKLIKWFIQKVISFTFFYKCRRNA